MTVLLVIIYISFISLGLPDALLGSAWPVINTSLGVPLSFAGIISMIVSGGTIISSMLSDRMIRKFGTGKITLISVAMTALALLGYSLSQGFWMLCLMAVPLGLGAGAVDAALNNFVSLHYEARHMNWLHCFWGVGATTGPYIMSVTLMRQDGWKLGYRNVAIIQAVLVVILIASLPLWKKAAQPSVHTGEKEREALGLLGVLRVPYAKETLVCFFCYCAIELTAGQWASSFLVISRGISAKTAARWVSLYYLGITAGRFASGFLSMKLNHRNMVRTGLAVIGIGVLLMFTASPVLILIGLIAVGLGCAPIYPSMLHDTPNRFGRENAQAVMGIQMACAYVGSTVAPPLFGLIADCLTPALYPIYLLLILLLFVFLTERVNSKLAREPIAE